MILCAKQRWESMGDALRKLLQEACAIWPRGAPIALVLSAQLCTCVGKARTGKIVSAWEGRLGVVCSCRFNDDRAAARAMMRVHFIPLLLPLAIKGAIIAAEAVLFEMLR